MSAVPYLLLGNITSCTKVVEAYCFKYSYHTYGAFAAGRDFGSIIVTKNFKLTISYELIYGPKKSKRALF